MRRIVLTVVVGTLVAGAAAAIALATGTDATRTYDFSGTMTGTTKALPVDHDPVVDHAASLTTWVGKEFFVESFAQTDIVPGETCRAPDGSTGAVLRLVPGTGDEVWQHPQSEAAFMTRITSREMCVSSTYQRMVTKSQIIGGWGRFEGATGTIETTDIDGKQYRVLTEGRGLKQLTTQDLGFYIVATRVAYKIHATVPAR